ncbi:MAG TPA: GTPase ObgE [bacterium]|nr:GTPase ObgE [bacterium]
MFLDRAFIEITAGQGGNGCCAFRRERYVPRGGPSGGDGGAGGSVWMVVDPQRATLRDFRYKKHFKGNRGLHGEGSNKTGRSGEELLIPVPPGTVIFDAETDEQIDDLKEAGQRVLIARGGKGGFGNARFTTSTNQAPRRCDPGEPGETRRIRLELKLIADVGLVGFPNVGKSTFLARVSEAQPKIADYPFTTLSPNLGVVNLSDFRDFVVADIPGILEGAHEGKGLGLRFLRHIERTRVLLFLVDLTSEDPADDLAKLRAELTHYGMGLTDRPSLVVLTKGDVSPDPQIPAALADRDDVRIISSVSGAGVDKLLEEIWAMVAGARAADAPEPAPE